MKWRFSVQTMTKPFNTWLVLLFSVILILNETALAKPPFIGVFSNNKGSDEEFTLTLMDDGKAVISDMAFVPFLWKPGPTNNQIILTASLGGDHKTNSVVIVFDSEKKEIHFLPNDLSYDQTLYLTTNEIPKQLHNILLHFDGTAISLEHPIDTIFALDITNHTGDLHKLQQAIKEEGLHCDFNMGIAGDWINHLAVDARDVVLVRSYATNQIIQSSLSVKIRISGEKNILRFGRMAKSRAKNLSKMANLFQLGCILNLQFAPIASSVSP